jgi:hypothetical protein
MKIIDAMRIYAENLVCPNGAPGYGSGGPNGKRVTAGADCTYFQEVLVICWRETGEERFLELAKKMTRWTIRHTSKWDWDRDKGNSYGWHFLMRGMLATIKATGNKRFREWYLDMARRNMTYGISEINFVHWMNWLVDVGREVDAGRVARQHGDRAGPTSARRRRGQPRRAPLEQMAHHVGPDLRFEVHSGIRAGTHGTTADVGNRVMRDENSLSPSRRRPE